MSSNPKYTMVINPDVENETHEILPEFCTTVGASFVSPKQINCTDKGNHYFELSEGEILDLCLGIQNVRTDTLPYIESAYLCVLVGTVLYDPVHTEKTESSSTGAIQQATLKQWFQPQGLESDDWVDMPIGGTCLVFCNNLNEPVDKMTPLNLDESITVARLKIIDNKETVTVEMRLMGTVLLKCQDAQGNVIYHWLTFNHDPRMKISPGS